MSTATQKAKIRKNITGDLEVLLSGKENKIKKYFCPGICIVIKKNYILQ